MCAFTVTRPSAQALHEQLALGYVTSHTDVTISQAQAPQARVPKLHLVFVLTVSDRGH